MKKTIASCIAATFLIIGLTACGNKENKTDETTTTTFPSSSEATPGKKTEISIGTDGAEVKTKNGTEVKVGEKGASVGNKDVDIKIGTKKDDNKN